MKSLACDREAPKSKSVHFVTLGMLRVELDIPKLGQGVGSRSEGNADCREVHHRAIT